MYKKLVFASFSLLALISLTAAPAFAAKPVGGGGTKPNTSVPTGNDISYPQCSKPFPKGQAFGIVGVNGGLTTNGNPCLTRQLDWAKGSTGAVANQPTVQVYVNTGNPGEVLEQFEVKTWPTDGTYTRNGQTFTTTNPYGHCTGSFDGTNYGTLVNDRACSWQYGWNRAVEAVDTYFTPAINQSSLGNKNPNAYTWWLDVEESNSWQAEYVTTNSPERDEAYARNVASLEGMMAFYKSPEVGVTNVGIYSTGFQWGNIVGKQVSSQSNLNGVDSWLAGAANLADAQKRCNNAAFGPLTTGGRVVLNQYVTKNLDYNFSCI